MRLNLLPTNNEGLEGLFLLRYNGTRFRTSFFASWQGAVHCINACARHPDGAVLYSVLQVLARQDDTAKVLSI